MSDLLHAPQRSRRLVSGVVGKHDDELFAAVAADDVLGAKGVAQDTGEEPQRPVAGVVAVGVVQPLEEVEVTHRRARTAGCA